MYTWKGEVAENEDHDDRQGIAESWTRHFSTHFLLRAHVINPRKGHVLAEMPGV